MEKIGNTIVDNKLGLFIGAGLGFLLAKKLVKTDKIIEQITLSIIIGLLGVGIQSEIKKKKPVTLKD